MVKKGWIAGAWWLACGSAMAGVPAHYVVFEVDAAQHVTPLYYRQVELAAAPEGRAPAQSHAHADPRALAYRVMRQGAVVDTRWTQALGLRAEFARDPEQGDQRIVTTAATAAERYFVLRLPLTEGDAVEFGTAAQPQRISLSQLAARSATLAYAGTEPLPVAHSTLAGNPANRVDLLVVSEGYTAGQQAQFDADAQILHDAFFNLTPYKEYRSFVNWTTAFIASNQSGASHPPYQAGCTQEGVCCADAAMQGDPRAGQMVDNRFGARFCTSQIHRLVSVDYARLMAAASSYPNWDEVVVVVNDPVYGGAGGPYSLTTTHAAANLIVLHEYGHAFPDLADEYDYGASGPPPCNDAQPQTSCAANVTNLNVAASIKWRSWFTPGIAIPTPAGTSGVGLFEGAQYLATGMYRPTDEQCLMRVLGQTFCPVCAQEYVRALYRGGWGVPAAGIDLIEPGSESPSAQAPVQLAVGSVRTFQFTPLQPSIGTLSIQWYLDGQAIAGATSASYTYTQAAATPASRTLKVRVHDNTALVNPAMAEGLLDHTRSWQIQVGDDDIFVDGFETP